MFDFDFRYLEQLLVALFLTSVTVAILALAVAFVVHMPADDDRHRRDYDFDSLCRGPHLGLFLRAEGPDLGLGVGSVFLDRQLHDAGGEQRNTARPLAGPGGIRGDGRNAHVRLVDGDAGRRDPEGPEY